MRMTNCVKVILLVLSLVPLTNCGDSSGGNPTNDNPLDTNTPNKKPIAVILPVDDRSIFVGESINFRGDTSFDPDVNLPLTYKWSFSGATTSIQESKEPNPGLVNFTLIGVVTGSLIVTDRLGMASDPVYITVIVNAIGTNRAPNGKINYTFGNLVDKTGDFTVLTGTNVTFNGIATDPDTGDSVTRFEWGIPSTVTTIPETPDTQSFTATFSKSGSYVITLIVIDNNGEADPTPAQMSVTVIDPPSNQSPSGYISHDGGNGTIGSVGDISIGSTTSVVFNSIVTDPENDPISYAWDFTGASPSTASVGGPIVVNYPTVGIFTVSLTVSDNAGNSTVLPSLAVAVSQGEVVLPDFNYLPVLFDQDGIPNDSFATYYLNVDNNVPVIVASPNGSWITPMMRYNQMQLPPVIKVRRGTVVTVNVQNNLNEATTVHWHGAKVPGVQDGGPDFPIAANNTRTYRFTVAQPAASLWFHPHDDGTTATQVYQGLAGSLVISDDISTTLENNKRLPSGTHDIPILIQDRTFAADDGSGVRPLVYSVGGGGMGGGMMAPGMLGDTILVNAVVKPALKVDTRQYRFRLNNGSNARTYDIALNNGSTFTVVGTDGGLLNIPVVTDHIMLSAGERADIVIDFGSYSVGEQAMLISRAFSASGMMAGGSLPNGVAFDVMRFDVNARIADDVVLYTSLPASADINTRLTEQDAGNTRTFVMSMAMGRFLINGVSFDVNTVNEFVASGATEIWDISNMSSMAHPFHSHAIQWQVLDRTAGGVSVPASGVDLGWKDTVLVQPGESIRIIGRFDPVINKGLYMYHCHILEHEDTGMMGTFFLPL